MGYKLCLAETKTWYRLSFIVALSPVSPWEKYISIQNNQLVIGITCGIFTLVISEVSYVGKPIPMTGSSPGTHTLKLAILLQDSWANLSRKLHFSFSLELGNGE